MTGWVTSAPIEAYPDYRDITGYKVGTNPNPQEPLPSAAQDEKPEILFPNFTELPGDSAPIYFDDLWDNALQAALRLYRGYSLEGPGGVTSVVYSSWVGLKLDQSRRYYGDRTFAKYTIDRFEVYRDKVLGEMYRLGLLKRGAEFPFLPFPSGATVSPDNVIQQLGWRIAQVIMAARRLGLNDPMYTLPVRRLNHPDDMNGGEPWPGVSRVRQPAVNPSKIAITPALGPSAVGAGATSTIAITPALGPSAVGGSAHGASSTTNYALLGTGFGVIILAIVAATRLE